MRILFVTNLNSIHAKRWIEPLIPANHEIYVASYTSNNLPIANLSGFVDLTKITNIRKIRFIQWGAWLSRYIHKIQPDLLHAHQITAAGWLGFMLNFHPFIVSAWGSDLLVEPNRSAIHRILVKLVFQRCDALTVPSPIMYTAAINLGFPAHRLHLIPWGIETGIFTPGNSDRIETRQRLGFTPDDYIILSPRRIAPICNIDTLILAFKKVSLNFPQLRLALIAFNPIPDYHNKIRSAIGQSGLENKITWLPIVREPSEMAQLYRMSDLVISIPSSEGYGFTVYEAMSTGVPTIISDLPIFHNELLNGVHTLKVPVRDIQATSEAIQKIYLDHSLQQTIVNNAMFICSEKSIDQRMKLVESLYAHTVREWTKKEASL